MSWKRKFSESSINVLFCETILKKKVDKKKKDDDHVNETEMTRPKGAHNWKAGSVVEVLFLFLSDKFSSNTLHFHVSNSHFKLELNLKLYFILNFFALKTDRI